MATDRVKKKIFERILLVGIFLFPTVIPLTFYMGHPVLSLLQGIYGLFLLFIYYLLKKNIFETSILIHVITFSGLIFLSGTAIFSDKIFIYWFYLFPVFLYFIFGIQKGAVINVIFGILLTGVLLSKVLQNQLKAEDALTIFLSFTAVGYIASILEISRLKIENKLKVISNTDFLTEILNRRGFEEALHIEVENARRYKAPFCLLFLDIDHFKAVNDEYGHKIGDKVLRKFVENVGKGLRITDQFFRIGGEEFAIILRNTDLTGGKFLSRRIISNIRNLRVSPVGEVTASLGLIQYSEISDVDDLMKRADKMLYKAKNNGRDRMEFQDLKKNMQG